jgi:hypothetical protein
LPEKELKRKWLEEHDRRQPIVNIDNSKSRKTTTQQATLEGIQIAKLKVLADAAKASKSRDGARTRYKKAVEEASFKSVSVFTERFGVEWDMINRIATDPAHEFHNLVKDMIALIANIGNMTFTEDIWKKERQYNRFKDVANFKQAPWHATKDSMQEVQDLTQSGVLKVPYGWPSLIHYFHSDYKKVSIYFY